MAKTFLNVFKCRKRSPLPLSNLYCHHNHNHYHHHYRCFFSNITNQTTTKEELDSPRTISLTKLFSFEEHQNQLTELFLSWKPLKAIEYYKRNILHSPPYKHNTSLQHLMINNLFSSGHDRLALTLMGPSLHLHLCQLLSFHKIEEASKLIPLVKDTSTIALLVVYHIKMGKFAEAKNLINTIIQSLSSSTSITLPPSAHVFDEIFRELFDKHQITMIDYIISSLRCLSPPYIPSQTTFLTLTTGFAMQNKPEKLESIIQWMSDFGIKPSKRIFNGITFAYSQLMDAEQLDSLIEETYGSSSSSFLGASISSLLGRHEYKKAMEGLNELRSKEEDGFVYEGLASLCKKLKASPLLTLLEGVVLDCDSGDPENQKIPSPAFLNIIIENNLEIFNYSRVDYLLEKIVFDWGMKLDSQYLKTITSYFANNGNFLALERIHSLFDDESLAMIGVDPFIKIFFPSNDDQLFKVNWIDIYGLRMAGCHRGSEALILLDKRPSNYISIKNRVDISFALDSNVGVKDQFEFLFPRLQFMPSISSSNWILFKLLFIEDISSMMNCWELIKSTPSVKANSLTFLNLIKGCIVAGDRKMAQLLIIEMGKYSLAPSPFCCAIVLHELCRLLLTEEAEIFLKNIHDLYQISFNHIFFASLIYAYTRKKEYSSVFKTFDRLERRNQKPDTESCNYIIVSLLELGECDEAMRFIKMMDNNGIARNIFTYNYMADALIINKEYESLLEFLKIDTIKEGNSCSSAPFNRLLSSLYTDGLCDDLFKVVMVMVDSCCKFSLDTIPFIMKVFHDGIGDPLKLNDLLKIVMKLMVDISNDSNGYTDKMVNMLIKKLDCDNVKVLENHIAKLHDIRILWCDTSDLIKKLQSRKCPSVSFNSDNNNLFPRESITNNENLTIEKDNIEIPNVDLNALYSSNLKLNN